MKQLYFSTVLNRINGGPADLALMLLKSAGEAPHNDTIAKWKRTNRIPGNWIGAVLWACACFGIDPLDLLVDDEQQGES